jgi:hypothetical protein
VRQLNTVDTIRETLTESNTRRKIINIVLALTRANDKLKAERKMKMNKKELLDKQELWVIIMKTLLKMQ